MSSITFKLPTSLRERLTEAAKKDGRNLSDFIRHHFAKKLPAPTPNATQTTPARRKKSSGVVFRAEKGGKA